MFNDSQMNKTEDFVVPNSLSLRRRNQFWVCFSNTNYKYIINYFYLYNLRKFKKKKEIKQETNQDFLCVFFLLLFFVHTAPISHIETWILILI